MKKTLRICGVFLLLAVRLAAEEVPPATDAQIHEAAVNGFVAGFVWGVPVFIFGFVLRHFRRLGDSNPSL